MSAEDNDRRIREVVMDWLETSEDTVSGPMRHYAKHYIVTAEAEVARCREIAERDGKDYSDLLQSHHSLCGQLAEMKEERDRYKAALEKIRAMFAQHYPEPYLACGPDEDVPPWVWRQCDGALAVFSGVSSKNEDKPNESGGGK